MKLFWLSVILLSTACAGSAVDDNSLLTASSEAEIGTSNALDVVQPDPVFVPSNVPPIDTSNHSVPLSDVYFDTFRAVNRALPLDEAEPELIVELRDAIPPIHAPIFELADEADWLDPADIVLGYADAAEAWAFPIKILNFHEIVNTTLNDAPILISYCPLCYSGIVYSRLIDGEILTFGNTSALYDSDMVMLDYESGSYWWQVAGEAIVGERTGDRLTLLPSQMTSWQDWQTSHPGTLVLSRDTGHNRNYGRDPFADYQSYLNGGNFAFPVGESAYDDRLQPGARVLTVARNGDARTFRLDGAVPRVQTAQFGDDTVVVFIDPRTPTGTAWMTELDGNPLTFEFQDGKFIDLETGGGWDISGKANSGELAGSQLEPVPSKVTFWFAVVAAYPDVKVVPISTQ